MTIEDRLRAAAADRAADVAAPGDRWEEIEAGAARLVRTRQRRRVALGAATAVAAAFVTALVAVPALRGEPRVVVVNPSAPTSIPASPTTATSGPVVSAFAEPPLWPFASEADGRNWQESYRAGGDQPWHLDADETALSFTGGYLGYTEVNKVISHTIGATDARVGVGFPTDGGRSATAAVIHLVRLGAGSDAPWEVVGTDDTDLTLTLPRYGSLVASPLTVGGTVSGVDESLKVLVRQLSSPDPIGESCCLPEGGIATPWQTTVGYHGATDDVLTIAVSTGGHLRGVERFAVTGVRPRDVVGKRKP